MPNIETIKHPFHAAYEAFNQEIFVERRSIALRAALANSLAILVGAIIGNPGLGVMGYFGTLIIQYGEGRAHRFRFKLQLIALVFVYALVILGYVCEGKQIVELLLLIFVGFASVFVVQVLKVGPPGAFYMMFSCGMGIISAKRGVPLDVLCIAIALGATLSIGLTGLDTLINRHKPERKAIAKADVLVTKLEALPEDADIYEATNLQAQATQALMDAWTSLVEAGLVYAAHIPGSSASGIRTENMESIRERYRARRHAVSEDFVNQLRAVHHRFVSCGAYLTTHEYAEAKSPAFALADRHSAVHSIPIKVGEFTGRVLGKPTIVSEMEDALRWPSEPLLIAGRSAIGAIITAACCTVLGVQRVDWAMAFTVLLLNMGGTRSERYKKTFMRAGIAWLGIAGATVLVNLPFNPYILAAEIFVLRYIFVSLSAKYYNFSAVFMSLTATISVGISVLGFDPERLTQLATERAIESNFAILSVFLTITFAFTRSDELFIRGYAYRTVKAIGDVIDDVVCGRVRSDYAMTNRRNLYFALLRGEKVAVRASADDPKRAGVYRQVTREIQVLGFQVVGACLHPLMSVDTSPFAKAGESVTNLLSRPFSEPSPPEELERIVREAQSSLRTGTIFDPHTPD